MELRRKILAKRGVFFSVDALISLIIIFIVVLIARPLIDYERPSSEIHSDILASLSNLKVSELDDVNVQAMIASGQISSPNKTLLEQIGEFYVYDLDSAKYLASAALRELNTTENVGVWYGNDLIFSTNKSAFENANEVEVARQVLSGIEAGQNITGFSARAALSSNYRTNYFYFGGYVGDGNVSFLIDYNGNITGEAEMELVINTSSDDFEFYVNGVLQGTFDCSPSPYEPVTYTFNTTYLHSGENTLEFRGENLYIAGGFVKISYRGDVQFGNENNTYYFPGIDGLINIYDGFFVPQNLSAIDILLHMQSNYTVFLNIGNVTVYNSTTNGEENISLSNSYLSGLLNYGSLEGRTIPLRLGLENASYVGIAQKIDVFSVTDLSGSMDDNCYGCNTGSCTPVAACSDSNGCKICDSKQANYLLIDYILNTTGNRVGLAGYESAAYSSDYHSLSNDSSSLNSEVSSWNAAGNTCICCGIAEAIDGFLEARNNPVYLYYDFNDEVLDKSEIGYDGTLHGAPSYVSGLDGSAMKFDGVDDYVSSRDVRVGDRGTIAFWIKVNNNISTSLTKTQGIWSKYRDDYNDAMIAFKGSDMSGASGGTGAIQVKMESGNSATYIASTTRSWTSGIWYHIALTWGGGTTRLYVNGAQQASTSSSKSLATWADGDYGRAEFDSYNLNSPRYLNGSLDDFRIYNTTLSSTQIQALMDSTPSCQNGAVEVGEACDDGNSVNGDGCSASCTSEANERYLSAVVMSDGEANVGCTGNYADSVDAQQAIDISEDACDIYGIVVHSVGFAVNSGGESTLTSIADNGCGGRYYYSDTTNLTEVYRQIAYSILTDYNEQTITASDILTKLYPDSYIRFNYPEVEYPYGLIVTAEAQFDNAAGGDFYVPEDATPLLASVVSYSGPKWTSDVSVNNASVFDLDSYGSKFVYLGDPYQVKVLGDEIHNGTNFANVSIAASAQNKTAGSIFDKIIYTLARNASTYSKIVAVAHGCIWNIEMEDGSLIYAPVPSTYLGNDYCYYNSTSPSASPPGAYGIIANENDAFQLAVLNLLRQMDLNSNGKSDVSFTQQDLQISLDEFSNIPFAYYTEVEVRRWE